MRLPGSVPQRCLLLVVVVALVLDLIILPAFVALRKRADGAPSTGTAARMARLRPNRTALGLFGPPAPAHVQFPFKIFVYDLPLWANTKILERFPNCDTSVFGSEIRIHEALMRNDFGVRTTDPEQADFFFVPTYAACLVSKNFMNFDRYRYLVKAVQQYIMDSFPYWHRSRGRDHIWVFAHDFGGCLSWLDNTERVFYHELRNAILLTHLGDLEDIVIPPYVSDPRFLAAEGGKDLNVPGKHKRFFAYFRGTINWFHARAIPELKIPAGHNNLFSRGVRQHLQQAFRTDAEVKVLEGPSDFYYEEIRGAQFCLCPRGFATWSRRLVDAILIGCIPVIIADSIELPFETYLDYRKFTVKVAEADLPNLKTILQQLPPSAVYAKQLELQRVWRAFTYTSATDYNAMYYMLLSLREKLRTHKPVAGDSWT